MTRHRRELTVDYFPDRQLDPRTRLFRCLRKRIFYDFYNWRLDIVDDEEVDQFDGKHALVGLMYADRQAVGGFRAISCDLPYLGSTCFGQLATRSPYPSDSAAYEITRFGVDPRYSALGPYLYAAMFGFAHELRLRSLVAVVDLAHERHLLRSGIVVRRFGDPQVVGVDQASRPISAVAGEISLPEQRPAVLRRFNSLLSSIEVTYDASVFGPARLSA